MGSPVSWDFMCVFPLPLCTVQKVFSSSHCYIWLAITIPSYVSSGTEKKTHVWPWMVSHSWGLPATWWGRITKHHWQWLQHFFATPVFLRSLPRASPVSPFSFWRICKRSLYIVHINVFSASEFSQTAVCPSLLLKAHLIVCKYLIFM